LKWDLFNSKDKVIISNTLCKAVNSTRKHYSWPSADLEYNFFASPGPIAPDQAPYLQLSQAFQSSPPQEIFCTSGGVDEPETKLLLLGSLLLSTLPSTIH